MASGAWTVWEARSVFAAGGSEAFVEVSMGLAFGTVQFVCGTTRLERVRLVPSEALKGGDGKYENAATGSPVDFSDPFCRDGVDVTRWSYSRLISGVSRSRLAP